jgi:hypothetical protein
MIEMAIYLARACPRCNGYLGVVLREPERKTGLRAILRNSFRCHHRLQWKSINRKALRPPMYRKKVLHGYSFNSRSSGI